MKAKVKMPIKTLNENRGYYENRSEDYPFKFSAAGNKCSLLISNISEEEIAEIKKMFENRTKVQNPTYVFNVTELNENVDKETSSKSEFHSIEQIELE